MRTIAFASFRIDRIRASAKYPRFELKGNQKNLHDEFLELFDTCRKAYPDRFRAFATTEKNGGRYEERKCVQTDYVEWFPEVGEWRGLRSVIMVEECRITKKDPTHARGIERRRRRVQGRMLKGVCVLAGVRRCGVTSGVRTDDGGQ